MTCLALAAVLALQYQYEPGATHEYTLTREYIDLANGETTAFTDRIVYEVKSVSEIGVATLAVARTPISTTLDGLMVPLPERAPLILTEERNRRGQVRNREPHPYESAAFGSEMRLLDIVYPHEELSVGDIWTTSLTEGGPLALAGATWSWRLDSVEDGKVSLSTAFREDGGKFGEGEAIIDAKTGWPIRIAYRLENARAPGEETRSPMALKLIFERAEPHVSRMQERQIQASDPFTPNPSPPEGRGGFLESASHQ